MTFLKLVFFKSQAFFVNHSAQKKYNQKLKHKYSFKKININTSPLCSYTTALRAIGKKENVHSHKAFQWKPVSMSNPVDSNYGMEVIVDEVHKMSNVCCSMNKTSKHIQEDERFSVLPRQLICQIFIMVCDHTWEG